jgi:hypothetical protein
LGVLRRKRRGIHPEEIEKARRAADFLVQFIELQPDPTRWFYSRVTRSFDYMTDPDPRSPTYSAIEIGAEKQAYWFLGLPCAALAQTYDYTGDSRYLDAAKRYFDTFLACGEPAYRWVTSGKSAWAAAMLYRITGDPQYLAALRRILGFFFTLHRADGRFMMPGMSVEEMGPKFLFDVTPEYIRWFLDIAAELGVAERTEMHAFSAPI